MDKETNSITSKYKSFNRDLNRGCIIKIYDGTDVFLIALIKSCLYLLITKSIS